MNSLNPRLKKALKIASAILGIFIIAIVFPNPETKLITSVTVNAPIYEVYQVLSDIDNVDEWVEPVLAAECISEIKTGKGATRECKLKDGSIVQETVLEASDLEFIKMEMIKHDLPVDYFRWEIRTSPEGSEMTNVRQTTSYSVKFGLIGVILNQLAVKSSLENTFKGAYQGLKTYVENKTR